MATHTKLTGLMEPYERLARVAVNSSATAREALTGKAGSIYIPNGDGTGTIIGALAGQDPTGAPQGRQDFVGDTTPPSMPTGVSYATGDGRIHCYWTGTLTDGVPADFAHVEFRATYTAPEPTEDEDGTSTQSEEGEVVLGRLRRAASLSYTPLGEGYVYICYAVAVDVQGNESEATEAEAVTVANEITEVRSSIEQTSTSITATVEALSGDVTTMSSSLELLQDSLSTLVTDSDGESLMQQTAKGWTWSTSDVMSSIAANASSIEGVSGNVDDLAGNVGALAQDVADLLPAKDYMSYEDGVLELGKTGNPFKVRITNERISFVQNGSELAYLSNNQLYITSAIVTDELRIGQSPGYIWKYRANGHLGLRYQG